MYAKLQKTTNDSKQLKKKAWTKKKKNHTELQMKIMQNETCG